MTHLKLVSNNPSVDAAKPDTRSVTLTFVVLRSGVGDTVAVPSPELREAVSEWAARERDPETAYKYAMGLLIELANGGER